MRASLASSSVLLTPESTPYAELSTDDYAERTAKAEVVERPERATVRRPGQAARPCGSQAWIGTLRPDRKRSSCGTR